MISLPSPVRRTAPTLLAVCAIAVALVALVASPAAAFGSSGSYRTAVTSVSPKTPGISVVARPDGSDMVVTNKTATTLVILGYQGEPYLRVDTAGTWENEASPSTYLNKEYYIDSIPKSVNADKAPKWKKLDADRKAIWHDHRVHWMGAVEAPAVAKDPHHSHLIKTWTIDMVYGKTPIKVTGTLRYEPGSRWTGILTYAGIGVGVVAVLALAGVRRRKATAETGPTT